jgi:hypothetical protein
MLRCRTPARLSVRNRAKWCVVSFGVAGTPVPAHTTLKETSMHPTRPQASPPRRAPRAGSIPSGAAEPDAALELPAPQEHELIEGPSREDMIRRRAFDLYQRNGCVDGHALDDWLAAEAELGREVMEGDSPMDDVIEHE